MKHHIQILERYLSEGRRTVPISLIKPLIEEIREHERMAVSYLDTLIRMTTWIEELKQQIKNAGGPPK